MAYTLDEYKQDFAALNAATNALSAYVVGEGQDRLDSVAVDLLAIRGYWNEKHVMYVPYSKMVVNLLQENQISGFDSAIYAGLLAQAVKKIKSMRPVFRKKKEPCFAPLVHPKKCACANLARFKELHDASI